MAKYIPGLVPDEWLGYGLISTPNNQLAPVDKVGGNTGKFDHRERVIINNRNMYSVYSALNNLVYYDLLGFSKYKGVWYDPSFLDYKGGDEIINQVAEDRREKLSDKQLNESGLPVTSLPSMMNNPAPLEITIKRLLNR